jgi:hypothetical protein
LRLFQEGIIASSFEAPAKIAPTISPRTKRRRAEILLIEI